MGETRALLSLASMRLFSIGWTEQKNVDSLDLFNFTILETRYGSRGLCIFGCVCVFLTFATSFSFRIFVCEGPLLRPSHPLPSASEGFRRAENGVFSQPRKWGESTARRFLCQQVVGGASMEEARTSRPGLHCPLFAPRPYRMGR